MSTERYGALAGKKNLVAHKLLFDPFSKRIINMANKPTPEELTAEQIRATFGIQKRYRFGTE